MKGGISAQNPGVAPKEEKAISSHSAPRYTLNLSCEEALGIVGDVGCFLAEHNVLVREAAHLGDPHNRRFFFRAELELCDPDRGRAYLEQAFAPLAERYGMHWQLYDRSYRPRLLVLISDYGHCLYDRVLINGSKTVVFR